jgi:hypothetical protein
MYPDAIMASRTASYRLTIGSICGANFKRRTCFLTRFGPCLNPPSGSFIKPGISGARNHLSPLPTRENPIAGNTAARTMRAPAGAGSWACTAAGVRAIPTRLQFAQGGHGRRPV